MSLLPRNWHEKMKAGIIVCIT